MLENIFFDAKKSLFRRVPEWNRQLGQGAIHFRQAVSGDKPFIPLVLHPI
jgi:hypothetical protein